MGRKSVSRFGIWVEVPGYYFIEVINHFFGLKFFDAGPGSGSWEPGSGVCDGEKSVPVSGMNIKSVIRFCIWIPMKSILDPDPVIDFH
jgi:hypothetical protein